MNRAAAEQAELEKSLAEARSELRTLQFQRADEGFLERASAHEREQLEVRIRACEERCRRIAANLEAWASGPAVGMLPSPQVGLWEPLPLAGVTALERPSRPTEPASSAVSASHRELSPSADARTQQLRALARLVTQKVDRDEANEILAAGMERFPDDVEVLTISHLIVEELHLPGLKFELRRRLVRLSGGFPLPPEHRLEDVTPYPYCIEAGANPEKGLSPGEQLLLSTMWRLGFTSTAPAKPMSVVQEELSSAGLPTDVEHVFDQLADQRVSNHPLVERHGALARLTALGDALFTRTGAWRVLPIPLLLLRGVDGLPPYRLGDLLRAARAQLHLLMLGGAGRIPTDQVGPWPDFPWGGELAGAPTALTCNGEGSVHCQGRVRIEHDEEDATSSVFITELPPSLTATEVSNSLRSVAVPGVLAVSAEDNSVKAECAHPAFALYLSQVIEARGYHRVRWRLRLPAPLGEMLLASLTRRLEDALQPHRRERERLLRHAEALEGLAVFLALGERALEILRDADSTQDEEWALTHIASDALRRNAAFVRHTPLGPSSLRAEAARVSEAVNALNPAVAQVPRADYAEGFSAGQAQVIARTKPLRTLSRQRLIADLKKAADDLVQLDAPDAGREEALREIADEVETLLTQFPTTRRTTVRSRWW